MQARIPDRFSVPNQGGGVEPLVYRLDIVCISKIQLN